MTTVIGLRKVHALGSEVVQTTARPEFGEGIFQKDEVPDTPKDDTGSVFYSLGCIEPGRSIGLPFSFVYIVSFLLHSGFELLKI